MTVKKHIEALIEKAAKASDSGDAMRFSQAAANAANAACLFKDLDTIPPAA